MLAGHLLLRSDLQAIGAYIEHILLSITESRYGALWINDIYFINSEIQLYCHIPHFIVSAIAIGVPSESPHARPRKDIDTILDYELE